MSDAALRAEIYSLLSEAFKEPSREFAAEQQAISNFLQEAFAQLGCEISEALYRDWPLLAGDYTLLTAAYRQAFIFPVETRVVPVESVYRRWTQDPTAEVPFASEKGLLMSDHALHMETLYYAYGLTFPSEYRGMPDHICLELEFAAMLLEKTPERFALFLTEHLNWLPDLVQDAEERGIPEYYRQVIKVTAQFLDWELRRHSS
ncbi:MAG: molecular chaperone TorD family protein [Negativicutes bacterium]|nr:molecular chaperone TorD family protein [Negativicutes bacterium]